MPPIPKRPDEDRAHAKELQKNRLHNRSSGVVKSGATAVLPESARKEEPKIQEVQDRIAPGLEVFAVPITQLLQDPNNARVHNERNLESIKHSLCLYGQVKPVVVRKQSGVIVAGNGTHQAALSLGWTKLAAVFIEMEEHEAAGYGLADNRTAELAKWNFEVVAQLDALIQEAGHPTIGWSLDELEVLRAADWTPPVVEETGGAFGSGGGGSGTMVQFLPDHDEILTGVEALVKSRIEGAKDWELVQCLDYALREYLGMMQGETEGEAEEFGEES